MLIKENQFKFDWYRAGVDDALESILAVLVHNFDGGRLKDFLDIEPCRSLHNYEQTVQITNGHVVYVRVAWGGNTGNSIYVESTGSNAPLLADCLREHYPHSHYLMRCDSALDLRGYPDSFLTIAECTGRLAEQTKIVTENRGDWSTARKGRTLYFGSKTSDAFIRFYEKGKQLGGDDNWLRFEVQNQPSKMNAKMALAYMSPFEVFSSPKVGQLILGMLGLDPKVIAIQSEERERTDKDRALMHMLKQYSNTLAYFADRDTNFFTWLKGEIERTKSS